MAKRSLVVMGVSGSGKSTVADLLADRLGWGKADADDFHSAANVAKMHAGIPLTDADRVSWLAALRDWITGAPGDVVVACSALKRSYRDELRRAQADVCFLELSGDRELIFDRMGDRTDHFMPADLLDSQLATLEPLESDERGTVIDVGPAPDVIADQAIRALGLSPGGSLG